MKYKLISILICCALLLNYAKVQAYEQVTFNPFYIGDYIPISTNLSSNDNSLNLPVKSYILIEPTTGQIIYENNADLLLSPASITKIMTLLLVMEDIEAGKVKLEDKVNISAHAMSMGGSQIWLEPGEDMTVDDLLKATAVASANDASVALGEHLEGTEDAFVDRMNKRAKELFMDNTTFKNATGLDEDGHVST
ncbi:MAG: D-alanyl-D-alanine carboxypeptidase family protein, partial [Oscillospiraceae bacterium]